MDYDTFIQNKLKPTYGDGFDPLWIPDFLFPFQKYAVDWIIRLGRGAGFFSCGLGKSPMELVCAQNIVMHTNGRVLILMPLAICGQMKREAEKFGVDVEICRDGKFSANAKIILTNYQRLHYFNPNDFIGAIADESSIIKSLDGATTEAIINFFSKIKYRQLWTATAAPNDYIELGTSSEALGYLRRVEMMAHYFNHDGGETSKWRLKRHAEKSAFWHWVCSWARAVNKPSDIGFSDDGYILPPLETVDHVLKIDRPNSGVFFQADAVGLDEQRDERRFSINERCELAAKLAIEHKGASVSWCHLNPEGDLIESLIPGCIQVSGSDSDEEKEEKLDAFRLGQATKLVSKSSILGFGQNWQFCDHQTHFASHSFEQWFQCIRRSWRFGQKNPVRIDMISTDREKGVLDNLNRKEVQAEIMFQKMADILCQDIKLSPAAQKQTTNKINLPIW